MMPLTVQSQLSCENELAFTTASPFDASTDFTSLNTFFARRSLDDVLQWGLATFGDQMAQVTSFGPGGMVILDHLARLSPGVRVITIDTNFLFDETYALLEQVQQRYPIHLEVRQASITPAAQTQVYGPNLWQVKPDLCCYMRKVAPLRAAMSGLNAWIAGLRRDQAPTRANVTLVNWDPRYQLVKINPLAYWTGRQVWAYIQQHQLPYNPLHDQGYASIGCSQCTRPNLNAIDERAGRWVGQRKIECGIHLP